MRLEPILRRHAHLKIERPPELWEPDTEEPRFTALLDEILAAALGSSLPAGELSLLASNTVVEHADDGEELAHPAPAEYVAVTIRGPVDLGPDAVWHPSAPPDGGLLLTLHERLAAAGARYAYIRSMAPHGSLTVFLARLAGERRS